ncbi:MAG: hypothetical protein F9K29_06815 [Hyphomicrobiaceae bacterium]|nr:MAG: hypothetical protein F9K29_06815 [Hyphomicrobiaceae bacterium]
MAHAKQEGFRVDVDIDHARREGERVLALLTALRRRHDLARFEYTNIVRIVPGGETFSHPVLTLGNRFADNEDILLSTYLHEQMHWYLWYLGTPDYDPVAPFFDELVRRYPDAPIQLPDGARNYESTYLHLVVNWLEVAATSELIGRRRAFALAEAQWTYRWIYRTVVRDWDSLAELYERHGLVPIRSAAELHAENAKAVPQALNGARRKIGAAARRSVPPRSHRRHQEQNGRSVG